MAPVFQFNIGYLSIQKAVVPLHNPSWCLGHLTPLTPPIPPPIAWLPFRVLFNVHRPQRKISKLENPCSPHPFRIANPALERSELTYIPVQYWLSFHSKSSCPPAQSILVLGASNSINTPRSPIAWLPFRVLFNVHRPQRKISKLKNPCSPHPFRIANPALERSELTYIPVQYWLSFHSKCSCPPAQSILVLGASNSINTPRSPIAWLPFRVLFNVHRPQRKISKLKNPCSPHPFRIANPALERSENCWKKCNKAFGQSNAALQNASQTFRNTLGAAESAIKEQQSNIPGPLAHRLNRRKTGPFRLQQTVRITTRVLKGSVLRSGNFPLVGGHLRLVPYCQVLWAGPLV
ncbi:hypothetical protein CDAR_18741 [Caerostris darwini]|uniref:Uncharacterized protein n=1 Tax=Caerostris darwini TaxID=1538125 RepID=A0AAV4WCX1_9ARAC|nr:hypothetical protein CDAR_18741 [Caerostris darwini]